MASPSEKSSSSRSTIPLMPGRVVIAYDATRNPNAGEFKNIISNIQTRDGMIQEVDTITVLGVLHQVLHPMGFQMQIGPDSFIGTSVRAIKEEVSRMVDAYVGMLHQSAEECEHKGVVIEVKIVVGAPLKKVVIQEAVASNATWVVLNRHLRKELRYYLKNIPCKVALVLDNFSLEVLRPYYSDKATDNIEHKLYYSLSKLVPILPAEYNANNEQSFVSPSYRGSMSSQESSDSEKSSFASSVTSKSKEQSFFSPDEFGLYPQMEKSDTNPKLESESDDSQPVMQNQRNLQMDSDAPFLSDKMKMDGLDSKQCSYSEIQIATDDFSSDNLLGEGLYGVVYKGQLKDGQLIIVKVQTQANTQVLCIGCGLKTEVDSMRYNYSDIQLATNDFSSDNLIGEGGYGLVYKGKLTDGQLIAAKVRKEASTQGFVEFQSELFVLSFARHKNIVMLLGYCCKENFNILVYEYICNKSLEWHLFDNPGYVLEWHRRHAIAIGIAKGLRFLHEECRGSPIIHRDMRPSNIVLTHDFVPMLGDFGLAKWKTDEDEIQTRILGTLGYLAPEYVESGIVSVRTDVYAFGIVLIQLISGRKAVDYKREGQQSSLRQWALHLIETLALHELADPRLGESYNTYELYHMARTAYLCVQTEPERRPSMAEVLRFLEGESDHFQHLTEQFIPHYSK
ncbi:hypothetical protein DH2020_007238 [Rehmannia glutinosa]|uniref:Protein kinase domain-containing protein n=1 Tax=Rehmannia glutinosa TaxID=99300 RepID=A0ABR0TXH0_REHGL